ncbi:MAG TPA: hypothetical protein VJ843_05005 [Candidatus Saccharimonadales bacterium]|nr:hypothetical protein [Candidatus Saccharimonadales bacterium]
MEQPTPTKPVMDVMPPKPPAEHDGEASMSDRTRTEAGEGKSTLAVHTAPPLSDDDKASAEAQKNDASLKPTPKQKPAAHTASPKPHGPAAAITLVILGMAVLSALAILVYLNS